MSVKKEEVEDLVVKKYEEDIRSPVQEQEQEKGPLKRNFLMQLNSTNSLKDFKSYHRLEFNKITATYWWHELGGEEIPNQVWVVVCFKNKRLLSVIRRIFEPFTKQCFIYGRIARNHKDPLMKLSIPTCCARCYRSTLIPQMKKWGPEFVRSEPPDANLEQHFRLDETRCRRHVKHDHKVQVFFFFIWGNQGSEVDNDDDDTEKKIKQEEGIQHQEKQEYSAYEPGFLKKLKI